jgi:hypothetical protein
MRFLPIPNCWVLMLCLGHFCLTQAQDDEFRVYTEHPRLILSPQRLRLLKRERERESRRWRQFDLLVKGGIQLPEPGFSLALYYAVSDDTAAGRRAIEWALGSSANDLRQIALVYDWCQPILTAQQSSALTTKLRQLMVKENGSGLSAQRDRILAWISLDDPKHAEEAPLEQAVKQWWRRDFAPALAAGQTALPLPDMYAVLEILHAIRDNLKIDLRDAAPGYFAHLPKVLVIGNYPAPYRAPENDFHVPMDVGGMEASAQPDLNLAARARVAGLSMVAYDNNGLENQFLQGWLIQDRFSMMTTYGAPYEFLWANPYQPGLSYFQLPLLFHDENSGALFVRSAWDEDADWFALYGGEAELFRDGRITILKQEVTDRAAPTPLHIGETSVILGRASFQFSTEGGTVLVIGLKPRQPYLVETDDEEMREIATDPKGTLVLEYPSDRTAGVRVHSAASSGTESEGPRGKGGA